jgi:hypothetical protein
MNEPIQLTGHCYVLLQGNWIHPIAHRRHELLWYPERAMTLLDRHRYRPYVQSIVTEEAWLIGLYDRDKVRVLYDEEGEHMGKWVRPDHQTYAASHTNLTLSLLGIRSTIPAMTNDGGKEVQKFIESYKKLVDKAAEIYKHI